MKLDANGAQKETAFGNNDQKLSLGVANMRENTLNRDRITENADCRNLRTVHLQPAKPAAVNLIREEVCALITTMQPENLEVGYVVGVIKRSGL